MEAHVEVTPSLMFDCNTFKEKAFTHFSSYYSAIQRATVLQLYYAVDQPKVGKDVFRRNCLSVTLLEIKDIYLFYRLLLCHPKSYSSATSLCGRSPKSR